MTPDSHDTAPADHGPALPLGTWVDEVEIAAVLGMGERTITYLAIDQSQCRLVILKEYWPAAWAVRDARGHLQPRHPQDGQAQAACAAGLEVFESDARAVAGAPASVPRKQMRVWQANGTAYATLPYAEGAPTQASLNALELQPVPDRQAPEFQAIQPAVAPPSHARTEATEQPGTHCGNDNLPAASTAFLGREHELKEIQARLVSSRMVTLMGTGGMGKTRLALQAAAAQLPQCADGVWFLDLTALPDAASVQRHAAQVFGLRDEPGRTLLQTLVNHLKPRTLLLVLDNCEHRVAAAAEMANALLRGTPGVRILTSSREALRVPGEQVIPVLPMPLPVPSASLDALLACSAVQLFVQRAQDHRPDFTLTPADAPLVAELVTRLEGIPLAIELAAARIRVLSVSQVNARLRDRYQLLTRGPQVLHERQQTLRATVDWSFDLLVDAEQTLFCRLGAFSGGFTLEAAEAVCGTSPLDTDDVLDVLRSLVEKSLVMLDETGQSTRYRMLETLRDYAVGKLRDRGEFDAVATAHAHFFFGFAKTVRDGLQGKDQGLWVLRAEADHNNLRTATALAHAGGIDAVIMVKLAVALQGFWVLRGHMTEGREVVRQALALPAVQASPVAHAHALYVGAALALMQSNASDALGLLVTCLALRRGLGNNADIAATLSTLAKVQLLAGEPAEAARASADEALALLHTLGDLRGEAIALQDLGRVALYHGEFEEARTRLQASVALAQRAKHLEAQAESERMLGELAFELADAPKALTHLTRSRAICLGAGDKRGEACAQLWLGKLALQANDPALALQSLMAALATFEAHGLHAEWGDCLLACAALALNTGEAGIGRQLVNAVAQHDARVHLHRSPSAQARQIELEIRLKRAGEEAGQLSLGSTEGRPAALLSNAQSEDDFDIRTASALARTLRC